MRDLDVWYARLDIDGPAGACGGHGSAKKRRSASRRRSPRRRRRTARRPSRSSPSIVDGERADRRRPAADRPDPRTFARRRASLELEDERPRRPPLLPPLAAARPPPACSSATASSTSRARSSASAASARAPGSCCCSAATTTIRCSCRSRRPALGARAVPRRRASSRNQRPARRRGPAPDAGGERHLPRLGSHRGSTARARLLRAPALGLEGLGRPRHDGRAPGCGCYARSAAWTLARAHARSGDPIAIGAYLGKTDEFDRAIAEFAEAYADQNERDYAALVAAVGSGRVVAQPRASLKSHRPPTLP